ncbi:MAG: bifunctional folylpolyglutamate synthase/dihydrofolate synthase [Clostridia bacterium]|nr:bifunctional folylpolyglutamate synthase/dihydrofolate synthase [Lachnospiraceae bacterium]NCC01460.1 bifunctional folylpolyglutamate synthase/dihydrofolate synthase [Clostridia bacterium]NCD02124.1 bifunctional folylpolyglutamate synthase/dihydrofolate synthase [Clostridia bacterium]
MKQMTYEETMTWIEQAGKTGSILGLERMEELLERMNHPERALKIIHVAGTNGKGSVCTMISSILETAGCKVGRYISPTLYDYRERIQINGKYIEKEALSEGMTMLRAICEDMARDGLERPTIFEIETALGFWYFKKNQCDYVVLETGMGGRLDSTNVIEHPVLTVITSISMDHMVQLGNTLEAIAGEKAGILKAGAPAVIYPQDERAMAVIEKVCREKNISMTTADWNQINIRERCLFDNNSILEGQQIFDYKQYKNLKIHLNGLYQVKNACTAIEAIEVLNLNIPMEDVISEGLSKARWPGRFECLSKNPLIIIDGAHNPEGAESLCESVEAYFPEKERILMMGVFGDKDYISILKKVSALSDTLISFTPENARGLDSALLKEAAASFFARAIDGQTAREALELAKVLADKDKIIIIFGSLSTISTICDIV